MTIYDLKPRFQSLLRPTVEKLAKAGYTANQVTIFTLILSFLGGGIVLLSQINKYFLLLIPIIMFLRMALNAIDGMLAKEHNMKTKKGAMLNEISDVVSDTFLYLPFAFLFSPIVITLFVITSILTEFTGICYDAVYGVRRYDGPMGKSDRAFIIGLISILFIFGLSTTLINTIIIIAIMLSLLTVANRFKRVVK